MDRSRRMRDAISVARSVAFWLAVLLVAATMIGCTGGYRPDEKLPRAEEAYVVEYEYLLGKYVGPKGVRYAEWRRSQSDLTALSKATAFYARTLPPENREASLAWHLNAYNANVLEKILSKYPTSGPLSGDPLFFRHNNIILSGGETSLDTIEQGLIRPIFNDPRIHFALNCAAKSCPPLHADPFEAGTLDGTLEELTGAFLKNNPEGLRVEGGKVMVSRLLDWYAVDFGGSGRIVEFLNRYVLAPVPADAEIGFLYYSWELNEDEG